MSVTVQHRTTRQVAYLATVYHDEEENANTNSESIWFRSYDAAVDWARQQMVLPYWNGYPATVLKGEVVKDPYSPARWQDIDDDAYWLVYAGYVERER